MPQINRTTYSKLREDGEAVARGEAVGAVQRGEGGGLE